MPSRWNRSAQNVEQPLAGREAQLGRRTLELLALGGVERVVLGVEVRGGVHPRGAGDQAVDLVGEVVVVADGLPVAILVVGRELLRRDGRP
jgi:hypothetical protein